MLKVVLIILLLFNFYLFLDLISPPKIQIIYPKNKEIIYNDNITFKGFVDKRGEFFINEIPVYFDQSGYFEKNFPLKAGINNFLIREKKFWGQETKIEREVVYIPK
jgi:hypothetical protein